MIGAVNRVPPIPLHAAAARDPTSVGRRAQVQDDAQTDPVLEAVRRAHRAEMETLLTSIASVPPGTHVMAAHALQEAERKLVRLKAEARAAAASGDRKAARQIARDLAVIARQIADAAQDYAVAEAQPDVASPALAKAVARMKAPSPAGDAVDAGALAGEAGEAAAEVTEVASGTEAPDDTAWPERAEADGSETRQPADSGPAPESPSPSGSGGPRDEDILVKAHRLFEEAVAWLRAMEALISGRPAQADHADPAEPSLIPVWPFGSLPASPSAARPILSHGR